MRNFSGQYRTADGKAQVSYAIEYKEADKPVFCASGDWNGNSGQIIDLLVAAYPGDSMLRRIYDVWQKYQNNDMRAGCEHQRAAHWGEKELQLVGVRVNYTGLNAEQFEELKNIERVYSIQKQKNAPGPMGHLHARSPLGDIYIEALNAARLGMVYKHHDNEKSAFEKRKSGRGPVFEIITDTKTSGWVLVNDHPEGELQKPCPVCRYRYGTAWLYEPIPAEVLQEVESWLMVPQPSGSLRDHAAALFFKKHDLRMRITLSDTKAAPWQPSGHHYRVTLSRPNAATRSEYKRMVFDFWGSAHAAEEKKDPKPADILETLGADVGAPETFGDYCREYGEDSDSIKALQTFNRLHKFADRLKVFFLPDEIEDLQSIR